MKYRNAKDIFPEDLLRQIQRYVSGETVYIPRPDGSSKRQWGETSGYQQFIRERNAEIDVVTVSSALGHSAISTTLTTYSHFFADSKRRASNIIADIIEGKTAS